MVLRPTYPTRGPPEERPDSAASFRAPVEVIERLLEAYPEAALITNNYGNLALHFTAWKKGPLDAA